MCGYLVNASPIKPDNLIEEQEGREQCVLGLSEESERERSAFGDRADESMEIIHKLEETEHFTGQAGGLVDILSSARLSITHELGSVLYRSAYLVPRLRLVQIHY